MPLYNPIASPSALNQNRLLWSLIGANMNSTADQAFTKAFTFSTFHIDRIRVTNASASLTLAAGGIYGGAGKTVPLVAAAQIYSALTGGTLGLDLTALPLMMGDQALSSVFLALTLAQGGAATADFRIYGWSLS